MKNAIIIYLIGLILGIIGWILNIVDIINKASDNSEITTTFIIQCIGIFIAPLGAVLGWISIF